MYFEKVDRFQKCNNNFWPLYTLQMQTTFLFQGLHMRLDILAEEGNQSASHHSRDDRIPMSNITKTQPKVRFLYKI